MKTIASILVILIVIISSKAQFIENTSGVLETSDNVQTQGAIKLKEYLLFDADGNFTGSNYFTIQDHPTGNYLRLGYGFSNHLSINSQGRIGLGTSNATSKLSIRNAGSTDGVKLLDFSELDDEEFLFKGYFQGSGGTGNKISLGSSNIGWQSDIMSWRGDGNVGIGLTNPQSKLHITSSMSGDAVVKLEADTDNNNEGDNTRIEMFQDGGSLGAYIGFNLDWAGSAGSPDNMFRIGVLHGNIDNFNSLVINTQNGNIGIGHSNPDSKLVVDGKIRSEEVKVEIINGPDYVFEPNYKLRTLHEMKEYISENKHLPEIPSAKEMELTLYQIELLERLEKAEGKIQQLENK